MICTNNLSTTADIMDIYRYARLENDSFQHTTLETQLHVQHNHAAYN